MRAARRMIVDIGRQFRDARLAAGLSQAAVARAARIPRSTLSLIERGMAPRLTLLHGAVIASVLGLDVSIKLYPAGRPVRDAGHLRLLRRFRGQVARSWRWRYEVGTSISGDQRGWDALLVGPVRIAIEAETHLHDVQALLRRVELKWRDSNVDRVVIVIAATRHNRAVLEMAAEAIDEMLPCPRRKLAAALREGTDPGSNGYLLV
jgi:transcriptional regulator with XRE-family HTH domain